MVLKSIGYKSVPIDGLPFDHQKGMRFRFTKVLKNTYLKPWIECIQQIILMSLYSFIPSSFHGKTSSLVFSFADSFVVWFSGIVPNIRGRVVSYISGDAIQLEEGLYVCGWLKRGPTGIIATNLYCAQETVSVQILLSLFGHWFGVIMIKAKE